MGGLLAPIAGSCSLTNIDMSALMDVDYTYLCIDLSVNHVDSSNMHVMCTTTMADALLTFMKVAHRARRARLALQEV